MRFVSLMQFNGLSFFNQGFFTVASKLSFVLLVRKLFHCMVKSSARLFASQESNQVSHAECGCEGTFVLTSSFLTKFRFSLQTLQFSALLL